MTRALLGRAGLERGASTGYGVEFRRNEQPTLFWLMFLVYGVAGIAWIVFALRLLTGSAEPLPLN